MPQPHRDRALPACTAEFCHTTGAASFMKRELYIPRRRRHARAGESGDAVGRAVQVGGPNRSPDHQGYCPMLSGRGREEIHTLRTIIPGTVAPVSPERPTGAPMKA